MKNKLLSIFALALLPASAVVPQVANADVHCVGNQCEVLYSYTGQSQTFSPPPNAANLSFEAYGAGGGRGGAGGLVSGTFIEIPETINVFVGGVGGMGSGVPGGYNGGGYSGGNSGTEGAGGGATDLRLGQDLESRIVVAGGGGGGGGEAGGNGGHGGTEFAAHGGSGQASGGGGGTQTEGGFVGVSNGGFQAGTQGQLGVGGSGGYSTFAGGGGGGGGYYGGGGGGADDNTCCSDGGGGGGGSSFANPEYVANIYHEAGVSWGHGWVLFRYTLVPGIVYSNFIQTSNDRAVFTFEASEDLIGFEPEELSVSGAGCEISELELNGTLVSGAVVGCEDGEVTITLAQQSFGIGDQGPIRPETLSLNFDALAPQFNFEVDEPRTSESSLVIPFTVTDQQEITPDHFELEGCQTLEVGVGELLLTQCEVGFGSVALKPETLTDSWQNTGPSQPIAVVFEIDQSAPVATWSEVITSGSGPFSYSANLEFSEPVLIENFALALASSIDCESGHEVFDSRISVWASCGYGNVNWSLTATATDRVGHQIELNDVSVGISNPAPVILPEPTPVYIPVIVEVPAPVASAPVTESVAVEPVTESATTSPVTESEVAEVVTDSDAVVVSEPENDVPNESFVLPEPDQGRSNAETAVAEIFVPRAPQVEFSAEGIDSRGSSIAPEVDPEQVPASEEPITTEEQLSDQVALPEEPQLAQAVAGDQADFSQPQFPWLPVLLVLGLGVLGVGAWRFSER